ncbi:MAG: hypothetical protein LBU32_07225 [Clostridiales bacterium]|jgi:hypothetical protein|nr:hypothetical protein [Clostridiales bacterium]
MLAIIIKKGECAMFKLNAGCIFPCKEAAGELGAAKAPNPRQAGKVGYPLADLPVDAPPALLRGANSWGGLASFAAANAARLKSAELHCSAITLAKSRAKW